jgi:ATP-dependent DNA helicase RecG
LPERLPEKLPENARKMIEIKRGNPYVTIEELSNMLGISKTSIKKNVNKLKERGIVERIGPDKDGYWKISEGFQVTVFGNEFFDKTENNKEKLTERLPEKLPEKLPERLPERLPEKLPENAQKMIGIIKSNPHVTIEELSGMLGISRTSIKNNVNKLKERGIVERIGSDKGGYWKITEGFQVTVFGNEVFDETENNREKLPEKVD